MGGGFNFEFVLDEENLFSSLGEIVVDAVCLVLAIKWISCRFLVFQSGPLSIALCLLYYERTLVS